MDEKGFSQYIHKKRYSSYHTKSMKKIEEIFKKEFSIGVDEVEPKDLKKLVDWFLKTENDKLVSFRSLSLYFSYKKKEKLEIELDTLLGKYKDKIERKTKEIKKAPFLIRSLSEQLKAKVGIDKEKEILEGKEKLKTTSSEKIKARYMSKVMTRFDLMIEKKLCYEIMTSGLHPYSQQGINKARTEYLAIKNIDSYLKSRHKELVSTLQEKMVKGEKFYGDPIDQQVIDYVEKDPTIESGVRDGNKINVTKIPFRTSDYLNEEDEEMKRYHYCHCHWARESLIDPDIEISPQFCLCSAGWYRQQWAGILDVPLEELDVEVLESVLQGDFICKFAIKIPEKFI